jgi:hypothetical protein
MLMIKHTTTALLVVFAPKEEVERWGWFLRGMSYARRFVTSHEIPPVSLHIDTYCFAYLLSVGTIFHSLMTVDFI